MASLHGETEKGYPILEYPLLLRVKSGTTLLPSQTLELIAGHLF